MAAPVTLFKDGRRESSLQTPGGWLQYSSQFVLVDGNDGMFPKSMRFIYPSAKEPLQIVLKANLEGD